MMISLSASSRLVPLFVSFVLLSACSPKYDWREVRGSASPFTATMPGKPSEYTRPVQLDQLKTNMTMMGTKVEGATFAIGVAEAPDAAKAQIAINMMKLALVKNIDGKIVKEKIVDKPYRYLEIEAAGLQKLYGKTEQVLLLGRFVADDKRIYQVIVAGRESPAMREAADTFLTSFKPK